MNCSSDLKNLANSKPSALNLKSFSRSFEQLFLSVGQNNFAEKNTMYICNGYQNTKNICSWEKENHKNAKYIVKLPFSAQKLLLRDSNFRLFLVLISNSV